jgi:hypothetical protein
MTTSVRKARLSPSSMPTRVSSKPEKISSWPDSEIQVGTLGSILRNVSVAPGCSKPSPWIGPLTMSLGSSSDMK